MSVARLLLQPDLVEKQRLFTMDHPAITVGQVAVRRIRVHHESDYLAITTVVQELRNFGRSRAAAMRICSLGCSPRMIGQ